LPDSNVRDSGPLRERILSLFGRRFGIPREALADFTFHERREEIWACSGSPPCGIESARPSGLRAFRSQPDGLKPTSAFLTALGDRITASRVDLDLDALRDVVLGQRIPAPSEPTDGYVALCFRGDVLGCGKIRSGLLQALIPTGRRRELLAALDADPRD
jgi:NOL1/NOP2/fmu family ribosome biogenesis protein